jgi:hypothetical protein
MGPAKSLRAFLGAVLGEPHVQHVMNADIKSLYELWSLFRCTCHGSVEEFLRELGLARSQTLDSFIAAVTDLTAPPRNVSRFSDPIDEDYEHNWSWELAPLSELRELE